MKYFDLSSKNRSLCHWINFAAASLLAAALAGCGGGGSSGSTTAAAPAGGGGGGGAPGVVVPTGAAPITLNAATPPATFAALTPAVAVGGVTINSPPVVSFSVTDGKGNAIIGIGAQSQSATATVPGYTNIKFALAKLVPGTGTAPNRWVSYIVTTVPTLNTATTPPTPVASVPTRPTTDNTGTLVDNKNGTYTYTFYRDVKQVAAQVAAATLTAPNVAADLDDLSYQPTLVHRLTIEISGSAPGTGTNTPTGVQTVNPVVMNNPLNIIYDFIPATGQAVPVTTSGRDIVATAKCNACHFQLGGIPSDQATGSSTLNPAAGNTSGLFAAVSNNSAAGFHGGTRNDTRYCVVCHTEQRKYGQAAATLNAAGTGYTGSTYVINGLAVGKLPVHIHKIHMGTDLTKTGYNYAGVLYNNVLYPQQITNCTTCHDGTAGAANATAQGDNWKNVPSRSACGACHDGINFTTGTGLQLSDAALGLTTSSFGHVGGAQADDSKCALCHDATTIPAYHVTVGPENTVTVAPPYTLGVPRAGQQNLPAGAAKITYKISSVTLNASKQPVVVFQIQNNGTPLKFNAYSATAGTEMITGFAQTGPSIAIAFAVPQDGITAPADFNVRYSITLASLWNTTAATNTGTLSGPDASGNYTAVITGTAASPDIIPANAVMVTAFLGYGAFTQDKGFNGLDTGLYPLGLALPAQAVQMVATGYTGRRAIVATANCNTCHGQLGLFTGIVKTQADDAFHSGQYNDPSGCAICHSPNGLHTDAGGWTINIDSWVHSIHAAAKRTVPFNPGAQAPTVFANIAYPGTLKNCVACHLPGTFDFSAPASAAALPNRLYSTAATGTIAASANVSPYVTVGTNYGAGFATSTASGSLVATPAAATTLVISPIATACFACHDSALAMAHIKQNGGSIYAPRSTALATTETCTLCHLAGGVADIAVMHQ